MIANGTDKAEIHSDSLLDSAPLTELEGQVSGTDAGPAAGADSAGNGFAGGDPAMTLLQGELIDDDENDEDQRRAAS